MKKIKVVVYSAGESRGSSEAVDYMLANVDGVELYAEAVNETWDEDKQLFTDEAATYDTLKEEITRQAVAAGVSPEKLEFYYDNSPPEMLWPQPLSQRETARILRYAQILHREAVYHPGGGPRRVIWTAKDGSDYTLATLEDVAFVLGQDGLAYVIAIDD